ncbi:MAG: S8 family peptidase [Egibacteraceae bacterium]
MHELRVAVETEASRDEAAQAVASVMPEARLEPLFIEEPGAGPSSYVVVAASDQPVGTPAHARQAHTLAQLLLDTGQFARAEADVPVRAFDRPEGVGAFGDAPAPPGSDKQWARSAIRCAEAWALTPPPGGQSRGEGIRIGHPDTGYTEHEGLGLAALDLLADHDFMDGDDDARDPLLSAGPLGNPGHGTATGSVIAGRGTEEQGVVGVAPAATLVPIRAVNSVVLLPGTNVIQAIEHARHVNCHVVSMSLGGLGLFGLRQAIQRAVDQGMIVMAAAGNRVGLVVEPASYDNCIAVAAIGVGDIRWEGSSRGSQVDVSAPGQAVHVASFALTPPPPRPTVGPGSGTSYAVAHLAGVAALWLAFHGRDAIVARYGARVQAVFLHLLKTVGHRVPADWDDAWGVGVVDAEALLRAPLPDPDEVPEGVGAFGTGDDPVARLAALLADADPVAVRAALAARFNAAGPELDTLLQRFEGELAYHVVEDDAFRESLLAAVASDAPDAGERVVPVASSPHLEAALTG